MRIIKRWIIVTSISETALNIMQVHGKAHFLHLLEYFRFYGKNTKPRYLHTFLHLYKTFGGTENR